MSDVEFHTQVPDRLLHACRWLRKATASGARVQVTADEATLLLLDQRLWAFSNTDFVPHCFQDAPAQVLANTAIVLSPHVPAPAAAAILLNLGAGVPAGFEQFARVIEIVSEDATEKQDARGRWKHYASMGCKLTNHSLPARTAT